MVARSARFAPGCAGPPALPLLSCHSSPLQMPAYRFFAIFCLMYLVMVRLFLRCVAPWRITLCPPALPAARLRRLSRQGALQWGVGGGRRWTHL